VAPKCDPELVELCSEMVIGDVTFLPDRNSMFDEVRRRGAGTARLASSTSLNTEHRQAL